MIKYKFILIITFLFIISFIFYFVRSYNDILATTTEQIEVISKDNSSNKQWIILANDKKIYIENFSIWALIEENENYTISYSLMKDTEKYYLESIVPDDYNGQF